jgi:uncharacterized membrane protein YqaE (UPF0057 family)
MILLLCYLCPPLAVLLMGRPFSAIFNTFLTGCLFWIPGIRHALVCYADYVANQQTDRVVDAINNPAHVQSGGGATIVHNHYHTAPANAHNPHVGVNGTVFQRKN